MSLRDAYRQKLEAQIDELNARLMLARAKSKKLAAVKEQLTALGNATEGAWSEMKGGVEKAWGDLRDAAKRAFDMFG